MQIKFHFMEYPTSKEKDQEVHDPLEAFYSGSYTYEDYLKFDFEEMVELIRGKLFRMSPAPRPSHQVIAGNLHRVIANYFVQKPCQVFMAPTDIILPVENKKREKSNTVVQPDICVICNTWLIEDTGVFGSPDWIIEILSPHTRKKDLQDKYSVYEECGVGEYWIVMPEEKLIECFIYEGGKYQRINAFIPGDVISPNRFPDLLLDVDEMLHVPQFKP